MNAIRLFATPFLFAAVFESAVADEQKQLPPDSAAQKASSSVVADVYKSFYEAAKTRDQKHALAKRLFKDAKETRSASDQFVMMRVARDVAAGAGELDTALEIVTWVDQRFLIDRVLDEAKVLHKAADRMNSTAQHKAAAAAFHKTIGEALAADRFEVAAPLAEKAIYSARQARDGDLLRQMTKLQTHVGKMNAAFDTVNVAAARLKSDPTNTDANLQVGKYRCFLKGDWPGGLPLLSLGSDAQIKAAAEADLATAFAPTEPAKLGDLWWAVGEGQTGPAQEEVRRRAAHWYRQALPKLGGLQKTRVEKRLAAVVPSIAPPQVAVTTNPPTEVKPPVKVEDPDDKSIPRNQWLDVMPLVDADFATRRKWRKTDTALQSRRGRGGKEFALPVEVKGSYQLEVDATVLNNGNFVFVLPVGANKVNFGVSQRAWSLQWVKGKMRSTKVSHQVFEVNKPTKILIAVRTQGNLADITAAVDGVPLAYWKGDSTTLRGWGDRPSSRPNLGGWDADIDFHNVRFRLLAGTAVRD